MIDDEKKELNELRKAIAALTEKLSTLSIERTHVKTKEACTFFSCSKNSLNKICATYGIRPEKKIGEYYYRMSDLHKVFQQTN